MMENKFLLSIIIPVYNSEASIAGCVESFLAAGVNTAVQIVLVDDGSTDTSGAICDAYEKQYENICSVHKSNGGPSSARNLGIETAAGKYIGFADSDDYVIPDNFRKAVNCLQGIECDVFVSDFYKVNGSGRVTHKIFQIDGDRVIFDDDEPSAADNYRRIFLAKPDNCWTIWRYFYKKKFIVSENLQFKEGISCGEDLAFSVKALMSTGRIAYYHNPFYCYRQDRPGSLSHNMTAARVQQLLEVLAETLDFLNEKDGSGADSSAVGLLKAKISREYILSLLLYAESSGAERKEILGLQRSFRYLMCNAAGIYRWAAGFIRLFGIPVSSVLMHCLKTMKNLLWCRHPSERKSEKGHSETV